MQVRSVPAIVLAGLIGGIVGAVVSPRIVPAAESAAPSAPETLAVKELTIVDAEGRTRIVMGMKGGGPSLRFRDAEDRARATMGFVPSAAEGKPTYWGMYLVDAQGNPRVLSALQDSGGGSSLQVRDNLGAIRFVAGFTDQGNGGITLKDAQNRQRFYLGCPPDKGYSMGLVNEEGETIWSAP
jgi:hypothetical protein